MKTDLLHNIFTGEQSPLMAGRIDSPEYQMGARRMENFIPMGTGGIRKRPGMKFSGYLYLEEFQRMINWTLSNQKNYLVVLEPYYNQESKEEATSIFVLDNNGKVAGGDAKSTTVFTKEEFDEIHYATGISSFIDDDGKFQICDCMWLVHINHCPIEIYIRTTPKFSIIVSNKPDFYGILFNEAGMYPKTVAFYGGRLCFGGTANYPNRIYLSDAYNSVTGIFQHTHFTLGTSDSDAIVIEESEMGGSIIQWIACHKNLFVGTNKGIWKDTGVIPTPKTFDLNLIENLGSSFKQPIGTKETLVFIGRDLKSINTIIWNEVNAGGGFIIMNISDSAAHLFSSGIKEMAVSNLPVPIIWIVTKNGELICCLIDMRKGITYFSRHITNGTIKNIVINEGDISDILFLYINRNVSTFPEIEQLVIGDLINEVSFPLFPSPTGEEQIYLDSWEIKEISIPTTEIKSLHRFNNKKICIMMPTEIIYADVNSNGTAYLPHEIKAGKIVVGLPYKSAFCPNEKQLSLNGSSQGKKRRIEKIILKLFKSAGGRVGTDEENSQAFNPFRLGDFQDAIDKRFTGDIEVSVSGHVDTDGKLLITQEAPAPFTMLSLTEQVAIMEA
jgi:uncharacterized protein YrzB (UPF0473 family)